MSPRKPLSVGDRVKLTLNMGAMMRSAEEKLTSIMVFVAKGTIVDEKDGGYLVRLDSPDANGCTYRAALRHEMTRLRKRERRKWELMGIEHPRGFAGPYSHSPAIVGPELKPGERVSVIEAPAKAREEKA